MIGIDRKTIASHLYPTISVFDDELTFVERNSLKVVLFILTYETNSELKGTTHLIYKQPNMEF